VLRTNSKKLMSKIVLFGLAWWWLIWAVLLAAGRSTYVSASLNSVKKNPHVPEGKPDGQIIAIDILPMDPIADVTYLQGDFREEEVLRQFEALLPGNPEDGPRVDLVLSDMAPNLSGVGVADAARMAHLAELALEFAKAHMKPEGALLIKCFHGSGYSQIVESFKKVFKVVAPRKPKASRDKSAETFLLGKNFK